MKEQAGKRSSEQVERARVQELITPILVNIGDIYHEVRIAGSDIRWEVSNEYLRVFLTRITAESESALDFAGEIAEFVKDAKVSTVEELVHALEMYIPVDQQDRSLPHQVSGTSWEQIDADISRQETHEAKEQYVRAILLAVFKSGIVVYSDQSLSRVTGALRELGPEKAVSTLVYLGVTELKVFAERLAENAVEQTR
jgi:hypothetical protein